MKSILYILISVFILSIMAQAIPNKTNYENEKVALEVKLPELGGEQLKEVRTTLSKRLKYLNVEGYKVTTNEDNDILKIEFDRIEDYQKVKTLLTPKGELLFCEILDSKKVLSSLDEQTDLAVLLKNVAPEKDYENKDRSLLGFYSDDERINISACLLKQKNHYATIQFAWGHEKEDGKWPLYTFKRSNAIDGSSVASSKVSFDMNDEASVFISFTFDGAKKWEDMTQRNIKKQIAIVMDNILYAKPMVQKRITAGKAMLSGKFTQEEIQLLNAVINGGMLPQTLALD